MNKLLIIVDMQNDFIDGSLANPDAQAIVPGIVDLVKNWEGSIGITLDTHEENYLETQEGRNLPVKHCIVNTTGHELNAEIKAAAGDRIQYTIMKPTFGYANWKDHGLANHFDEVTLVGTCTSICVASNAVAIKMAYPELKVSVIANLCADINKESHEAALLVMKNQQISIK